MHISTVIKEIRKELKLTQAELGEIIGIARSSIANYERKGTKPSSDFIEALVLRLNVNAKYIFTGQGEIFESTKGKDFAQRFSELFPDVPPESEVIELINSLAVDVVRHQLIIDYIHAKNKFKDFIIEHKEHMKEIKKNRRIIDA